MRADVRGVAFPMEPKTQSCEETHGARGRLDNSYPVGTYNFYAFRASFDDACREQMWNAFAKGWETKLRKATGTNSWQESFE